MSLSLLSFFMAVFVVRFGIYPLKIRRIMKIPLSVLTAAVSAKLYLFSLFCDDPEFVPSSVFLRVYHISCVLWGTLLFVSYFLFLFCFISFSVKWFCKKHRKNAPVFFTGMTPKILLVMTAAAFL